jgi:hypothetical protein
MKRDFELSQEFRQSSKVNNFKAETEAKYELLRLKEAEQRDMQKNNKIRKQMEVRNMHHLLQEERN